VNTRDFKLRDKRGEWEALFTMEGQIKEFCARSKGKWSQIDFRSDNYSGPCWYGIWEGEEHAISLQPKREKFRRFEGRNKDLFFSLEYASFNNQLAITAGICNVGQTTFRPIKAGIKLGLDCYMAKYPEWNHKYFPTLLRCEKTHFWGYTMTPEGRILGICSPDAIASYSLDYNGIGYGEYPGGHRIYTLNLDLLNALPLPGRHPQNLNELKPGEKKQWTIFLVNINSLEDVKPKLSNICRAPIFEIDRYTVNNDESCHIIIFSDEKIDLKVTLPDGSSHGLSVRKGEGNCYYSNYRPEGKPGIYTLIASNKDGKQSEAKVYLRQPWSWYLKQARNEAIRKPQKISTVEESWYSFFSIFLARKYFPNTKLDIAGEALWQTVFPLLFDFKEKALLSHISQERIQSAAGMASLLVSRYQCTGNIRDMEYAAGLVEFLIKQQGSDGGYYTPGGIHFTSVVYIAKSIMEVMAEEKKLSVDSEKWRARYEKHYKSVKAAMDDLVKRKDNIETEGEITFEDGMISCSALQLAMFALLQEEPKLRKKYTDAALYMMYKHHCLEQLLIPDSRMNGATLRFWEAQYDVLMTPNMMNSPHGWSAWKIYGTWYLYQLTGEEVWLRDTMNTLGSCVQLIDVDTGKLRWAFVPDPYIQAKVFVEDPQRPGHGINVDRVVGEEYIDMISDWWLDPTNEVAAGAYSGQSKCADNDVHEIFKALEEIALTSAYVLERKSGEVIGWNCRIELNDDVLNVHPSESIVSSVHINLKSRWNLKIHFAGKTVFTQIKGMRWLRKKGKVKLY